MYDRFNRKINYLRISLTDRCNLRCTYCMPEEGVILKKHVDILSFEEIMEVVKTGINLGISKAMKTGFYPVKINFVRIKGVNEEDEYEVKKFCHKHGLELRFIRQMDLSTGKFYPVE